MARPLPQFHLKQAVLSGDESLGEKQVVLVLGIDMGNAPTVAQYAYRLFKARYFKLPPNRREGGLRPGFRD